VLLHHLQAQLSVNPGCILLAAVLAQAGHVVQPQLALHHSKQQQHVDSGCVCLAVVACYLACAGLPRSTAAAAASAAAPFSTTVNNIQLLLCVCLAVVLRRMRKQQATRHKHSLDVAVPLNGALLAAAVGRSQPEGWPRSTAAAITATFRL
jgi:hypothetical protein